MKAEVTRVVEDSQERRLASSKDKGAIANATLNLWMTIKIISWFRLGHVIKIYSSL